MTLGEAGDNTTGTKENGSWDVGIKVAIVLTPSSFPFPYQRSFLEFTSCYLSYFEGLIFRCQHSIHRIV